MSIFWRAEKEFFAILRKSIPGMGRLKHPGHHLVVNSVFFVEL